MHRWVVVAAVLVAATCVSIPPFDPANGVHWDEQNVSITGSNFSLKFATDNFRFPTSLVLNGHSLIESDPQTVECNIEDQVGVAFYPEARASQDGSATFVQSDIDAVMYGPAVAKVNHRWQTNFSCTTKRSFTGFGSFTVFPDGTIFRYDTLADGSGSNAGNNVSVSAAGCSCANNDSTWHVSSFWTFAQAEFDHIVVDGATGTDFYGTASQSLCLVGKSGDAAVTYVRRDGVAQLRSQPRALESVPLVQDLATGTDLPSFGDLGSAANVSAQTVLLLGSNCRLEDVPSWQSTSSLVVNNTDVPLANDGIFGGDNTGTGGGYDVFELPVTMTGTIPHSFAVWFQFEGAASSLKITREGHGDGTWYIPQALNDPATNWVIWFRDPLKAGQTITIDPQP